MDKPLNPALFNALERYFGEGQVDTVHPGEPMRVRQVYSPLAGKMIEEIDEGGEEYVVACPFCSDHRKRLYINHRWGSDNAQSGRKNIFAMHCFNEECQNDYENCRFLYESLSAFAGQSLRESAPPTEVAAREGVREIRPAGKLIPLDILANGDPYHPALNYLKKRGFSPHYLAKEFDISYCTDSKYELARNRLIIPLYKDGKLVGWQARITQDWKPGMPPKYWTAPGTQKRLLLYNFDKAINYPTIVIVEGPTDLWRTGPCAVACWGKAMSPQNRRQLVAKMRDDATVVILLDPKQDPKERAKGMTHHIEALYEQLRPALKGRLLPVYLPDANSDPGSLTRKFIYETIAAEGQRQGVKIDLPVLKSKSAAPASTNAQSKEDKVSV